MSIEFDDLARDGARLTTLEALGNFRGETGQLGVRDGPTHCIRQSSGVAWLGQSTRGPSGGKALEAAVLKRRLEDAGMAGAEMVGSGGTWSTRS